MKPSEHYNKPYKLCIKLNTKIKSKLLIIMNCWPNFSKRRKIMINKFRIFTKSFTFIQKNINKDMKKLLK